MDLSIFTDTERITIPAFLVIPLLDIFVEHGNHTNNTLDCALRVSSDLMMDLDIMHTQYEGYQKKLLGDIVYKLFEVKSKRVYLVNYWVPPQDNCYIHKVVSLINGEVNRRDAAMHPEDAAFLVEELVKFKHSVTVAKCSKRSKKK